MELFKLLGTIAIENSDAMEAIDDTTDKAEDSSNKMVSAFKKIGTAVVAAFAVEAYACFLKALFLFVDFLVKMCLLKAWLSFTLPFFVRPNLFAAPL